MTTSTANAIDPLKQVMLPRLMAIADRGEKVIIGLIDGPVDAHLRVCLQQITELQRRVAKCNRTGLAARWRRLPQSD